MHTYSEIVERSNMMRLTPDGRKTYRRRSETVEQNFADAKQHHGHRYARFRSLAKVQMQCWMAATSLNIRKTTLTQSHLKRRGQKGSSKANTDVLEPTSAFIK
ncbi:hypothetical protein BCT86_05455 [Vibrio breoganii]|nr:hypothetical protein BCU83_00885 [Vibrio breoganii]PMK46216.1 hypothetical protein BCU00_07535 [Vibrio breoganii]PMK99776.1 hypothetical protein BCT86_05455 [Vibrio breoganii]